MLIKLTDMSQDVDTFVIVLHLVTNFYTHSNPSNEILFFLILSSMI